MTDKQKLIGILIGGGAALIIAIVVVVVFGGPKGVRIDQSYKLPAAFANAVPDGSGGLIFSNGRQLATYDPHSGQFSALTPDLIPSGLTNVTFINRSSDGHFLVFQASNPAEGSALYNRLAQARLNTAGNYWWLYSAESHSYTPLPGDTVLAKLAGGKLYTLVSGPQGEFLGRYNPADLQRLSSASVPAANNFFVTPYGYLLQTASELLLTKDGIVNRVLAHGATIIGITRDGTHAIATQVEGSSQNIVELSIVGGPSKILAKHTTGTPDWSPDGKLLYATSRSERATTFYVLDTATNKTVRWNTGALNTADLTPVALADSTAAIVSDPSGAISVVGSSLRPVKLPGSSYRQAVRIGGLQITLQATNTPGSLVAALNGTSNIKTEQTQVYAALRQGGYSPQLLTILFTAYNPGGETD